MFGFEFGKNNFIGIDIGTSAIKAVEITLKGNKPVLSNYAWATLDKSLGDRDINSTVFDAALSEYIKRMIREGNFKSKNVYASIPAFGGLIMAVELPEMKDEDLAQAIKFEAHKYIPTSLDEVALSWDVVEKKDGSRLKNGDQPSGGVAGGQDKMQVLLVAAPKSQVVKYEKLVKDAGLELKAIEVESFSLARSLVGSDPGNFVIVDIGSRVCNIVLVEKGIIKSNRNIDAGGNDITRTIARGLNIDEERAEKMKLTGDFFKKETAINFAPLDAIGEEIKRVLAAYYKEEKEMRIDGIILSGGSADFKGLPEYFTSKLNIKTMVGNPLGRIEYDKRLEGKLNERKTQFSVALGLALKGVEENLKK